jgi:acetyl esterase
MRIRDEGGPKLCAQLLNCPVTDLDMTRPSYRENAEGYFLTHDLMRWFQDHYLASAEDAAHPFVAPLRAENLRDLPPAYVLTAEFDPLRDEGELYADALAKAGVPVTRKRYDGMIHAFPGILLGVVEESKQAIAEFGAWLKERFAAA